MGFSNPQEVEAIRSIDLRQNQLLEDLDALNRRIELLLAEYSPKRQADPDQPDSNALGDTESVTGDTEERPSEAA